MVYIFNKIKNLFKNNVKVPIFSDYKMKNYFTTESIEVSVLCDTKDHWDWISKINWELNNDFPKSQ